jgi:hypothetical protein
MIKEAFVFVAILFLAPLAIVALNVLELVLYLYEKVVGLLRRAPRYSSVILKSGPNAYYRLDEAERGTIHDFSDNGYDARVKRRKDERATGEISSFLKAK